MALFKISKGNKTNLPIKLTEGYAYFCEDTHEFYIDHHDPDFPIGEGYPEENKTKVKRSLIRADSMIYWHNYKIESEELKEEIKQVEDLNIHLIPSQEIYNQLVDADKINSNHLYMIDGPDTSIQYTAQELTEAEKQQARTNIGAISADEAQISLEQKTTGYSYLIGTDDSEATEGKTFSYNTEVYVDNELNVLFGAAWNDYAEFRETKEIIEPGRVVCETGNGDLILAIKRLQAGANIVSDTYGFAIGKTEICGTPIAVSGRVLAYSYDDIREYQAGDAVCAGPDGTVAKMTRMEIREYPDRILGTVSEIPTYDSWNNVKVNGRIWIKVR